MKGIDAERNRNQRIRLLPPSEAGPEEVIDLLARYDTQLDSLTAMCMALEVSGAQVAVKARNNTPDGALFRSELKTPTDWLDNKILYSAGDLESGAYRYSLIVVTPQNQRVALDLFTSDRRL